MKQPKAVIITVRNARTRELIARIPEANVEAHIASNAWTFHSRGSRQRRNTIWVFVAEKAQDDFTLHGGPAPCTLYMLQPHTEAASAWVAEHLPEDVQMLGTSVAIEWRYVDDIVNGIQNDGLSVVRA